MREWQYDQTVSKQDPVCSYGFSFLEVPFILHMIHIETDIVLRYFAVNNLLKYSVSVFWDFFFLDSCSNDLIEKSSSGHQRDGKPQERTNRTNRHWPVYRTDISILNDSERLMIANRLLKIVHLLCPAPSASFDYTVFCSISLQPTHFEKM